MRYCLVLILLQFFPVLASDDSVAVGEALLWLKERESFTPKGCRLATKQDVRDDKISVLNDVILVGLSETKDVKEINIGHYVRIRMPESGRDTLGSRLGRMGQALTSVPTTNCTAWKKALKK